MTTHSGTPSSTCSAAASRAALASGLVLLAATTGLVAGQGRGNQNGPATTHRDQKIELATKITEPFTLVAVGDMIQIQPFSKYNDPDVKALVDVMRSADMVVANFEDKVHDFDNFGTMVNNLGTKEIADDWANMGIRVMSKANNHTLDAGDASLLEDFKEIERVGIVHVGAGKTQALARAARTIATPKGLFGFAGIYTLGGTADGAAVGPVTVSVTDAQLTQLRAMKDAMLARRTEVESPIVLNPPDPAGTVTVFGVRFKIGAKAGGPSNALGEGGEGRGGGRGRGGNPPASFVNNLRIVQYYGVTKDQMAQLRAIAGDTATGSDLSAFGTLFRVMAKPGEFSYDMNAADEREVLAAIRTGKQFNDFMATNIHWHQNSYAFQHYSFDHHTPDYEVRFAHEAIDNGDDVFVGNGVHTIKGVEIYKGKPIFYGISNFVFQSQIMPATIAGKSPHPAAAPVPANAIVGDGEMNEDLWAWLQKPENFEVLLTSSHFEHGHLTEVRLYPVDLGLTPRPGSQMGIPRRPSPEVARKILDRVIDASKPFGTKIVVENGVGVIRIPPNEQR